MTTLEIIGVIVAVVSGLKAIEYVIEKINTQHDKSQKIDSNAEHLEEYKKKNDEELEKLQSQVNSAHKYTTDALSSLEKSIKETLDDHRDNYVRRIADVESSINQMESVYQQTVAVIGVKIENLEKAQNKHNNLIERMYEVERKLDVQDEQIRVSNHRITDLEENERK